MGCGALTDTRWFIFQWPEMLLPLSIAHKELIPIVIAGYLWGKHWSGKVIEFSSDNQVHVLSKLYCRDARLMCYLRCLVFCAANHNFWFTAKHIPGRRNVLADAISRNKIDLFLSQAPKTMEVTPDGIPRNSDACSAFKNPTGCAKLGGSCSEILCGEFSCINQKGVWLRPETVSGVLFLVQHTRCITRVTRYAVLFCSVPGGKGVGP